MASAAARDALLGLAGRAAPAAAARRASAARPARQPAARGLARTCAPRRRRRGSASSGSCDASLAQRRDRTGHALPQGALVVAQPPPLIVSAWLVLDRGWLLGDFAGIRALPCPPWPRPSWSFGLSCRVSSLAFWSAVTASLPSALGVGLLRRSVGRLRARDFAARTSRRLGLGPSDLGALARPYRRRPWLGIGLAAPVDLAVAAGAGRTLHGDRSAAAAAAESRHRSRAPARFGTSMTKRPGWRSRPGDAGGLVAGAEIDIGARRADDGAAGVLRDHQAAEPGVGLQALDRQIGRDEERRAVDVQLVVDRDRAAGRERNALRADRLLVAGRLVSRKNT